MVLSFHSHLVLLLQVLEVWPWQQSWSPSTSIGVCTKYTEHLISYINISVSQVSHNRGLVGPKTKCQSRVSWYFLQPISQSQLDNNIQIILIGFMSKVWCQQHNRRSVNPMPILLYVMIVITVIWWCFKRSAQQCPKYLFFSMRDKDLGHSYF